VASRVYRAVSPVPEFRGQPAELVPAKLRRYVRAEWEQPGDAQSAHARAGRGWYPPFKRWKDARAAWVARHPGSEALGNKLERFRFEFETQFSPANYPSGATEWSDFGKR
jgi:hypothetical protein